MEIIREGKWICPNCNTKNKGSEMNCRGCGAIRGAVEFIYDEFGDEITDNFEKQKALAGPDWICTFCGDSNSADTQTCRGCSALRSDGKKRQQKDIFFNKSRPLAKPVLKPSSMPNFIKYPLIGVALVIGIVFFLKTLSFQHSLELVGKTWERQVVIEEYKTNQYENWLDKVPQHARIIFQQEKIRNYRKVKIGEQEVEEPYYVKVKIGTKKVKTGVVDLGNGRFKETWEEQPIYEEQKRIKKVIKPVYRDEPVYAKWVIFDLDEWTQIQTKQAAGKDEEEPYWPIGNIPLDVPRPAIGDKRYIKKLEKYELIFKSLKNGKEYKVNEVNNQKLTSEFYAKFKKGDKFEAIISGLGSVKEIKLPW